MNLKVIAVSPGKQVTIYSRPCLTCGHLFNTANKDARFCSEDCIEILSDKTGVHRSLIIRPTNCARCGYPLSRNQQKRHAKTCSGPCRQAIYRYRVSLSARPLIPQRVLKKIASPNNNRTAIEQQVDTRLDEIYERVDRLVDARMAQIEIEIDELYERLGLDV